jgi:hypothetical protein
MLLVLEAFIKPLEVLSDYVGHAAMHGETAGGLIPHQPGLEGEHVKVEKARLQAAEGRRLLLWGIIEIGQVRIIICFITCFTECLGKVVVHNRLGDEGA